VIREAVFGGGRATIKRRGGDRELFSAWGAQGGLEEEDPSGREAIERPCGARTEEPRAGSTHRRGELVVAFPECSRSQVGRASLASS
jgi:hypothetical protein